MKKPKLADNQFLADVGAASKDTKTFALWWLGQSGFLIHWQGRYLLLDPYLSDSLTAKYALSDKPHIRMTERVVAPRRLGFVDVVTSSHNHTDHLDAETLKPLMEANPGLTVIVPAANQEFAAERLCVSPDRLTPIEVGQTVEQSGFCIEAIPAAHENLDRNEKGQHLYLGFVVRFGPWTVYHSGDTVLYEGMVERLNRWSIDLALLPINGRGPERRVSGNLWGREAAQLAHAVAARHVIPCHYDMFSFNTASPEEFETHCRLLGVSYTVLECGQRWIGE